jgi:hypothetical protein
VILGNYPLLVSLDLTKEVGLGSFQEEEGMRCSEKHSEKPEPKDPPIVVQVGYSLIPELKDMAKNS